MYAWKTIRTFHDHPQEEFVAANGEQAEQELTNGQGQPFRFFGPNGSLLAVGRATGVFVGWEPIEESDGNVEAIEWFDYETESWKEFEIQ